MLLRRENDVRWWCWETSSHVIKQLVNYCFHFPIPTFIDLTVWEDIYFILWKSALTYWQLLFFHSPDESNGQEANSGHGKHQYAAIREHRVHTAIVHVGLKANVKEDHIGRTGADPKLCVPAGGQSHVSRATFTELSLALLLCQRSPEQHQPLNSNIWLQRRGHAEYNFHDIGQQ